MKVIAKNLITAVTASTANANYPASNLLDEYPGFLWKATGATATLTFTVTGTCSGLALFNTNATNASFTVSGANQAEWEPGVAWETGVAWSALDTVEVTQTLDLDGVSGACIVQWSEISGTAVNVVISMTNEDGDILQAGTAVGGKVLSYPGPNYRLVESINDLSYIDEYNAGGVYVKDRDVLRVFDCEHRLGRDDYFHDFIYSVKKEIKKHPAAWLVTDLDNARWLVYARFTDDPKGVHDMPDYSLLTYQLTEVR